MPTKVRSYSKINLGLSIGPLRPDGFHALSTIYQTLELHDLVTVTARPTPGSPTAISLTSNSAFVPPSARNTAWRMVESALVAMDITASVHIDIDKRLPIQGGLAGGSANAIAALIGLESELGTRLDDQIRARLAAEIGSDVPLFLTGGTMFGLGRGEQIHPLPDLPALECVIAAPGIGISTPQAFRDWDSLNPAQTPDLTQAAGSHIVEGLSRSFAALLKTPVHSGPHSSGVFSWREDLAENPLLALVRTGIENDFEQVVFPKYPLLGLIKRTLAASHDPEDAAIYTALSGSGSALFGLYMTPRAADAAVERLADLKLGDSTQAVAAFRTRTLPRQDYWSNMVVEHPA